MTTGNSIKFDPSIPLDRHAAVEARTRDASWAAIGSFVLAEARRRSEAVLRAQIVRSDLPRLATPPAGRGR